MAEATGASPRPWNSHVSLRARRMTTRENEEYLREMFGIGVSPRFISRATGRLQRQTVEWQGRPLERLYPFVYVDGPRVAVRAGRQEMLG